MCHQYCSVKTHGNNNDLSKEQIKIKTTIIKRKIKEKVIYVTWQEHTVKCTLWISTHNTTQSFGSLAKWLSVHLWTKWLWVRVQLQSPLFLLLGYLTSSITGWIFWTGRRYFNPWKVKHFANVSLYVLIFKFRYWRNSFRQKFNRTLGSSYDKCGFRAIFMKFRDPLNATTFLVFNN